MDPLTQLHLVAVLLPVPDPALSRVVVVVAQVLAVSAMEQAQV
jgi:hypothetical protein